MRQPLNDWETKYFASLDAARGTNLPGGSAGEATWNFLGEAALEGALEVVARLAWRATIELVGGVLDGI